MDQGADYPGLPTECNMSTLHPAPLKRQYLPEMPEVRAKRQRLAEAEVEGEAEGTAEFIFKKFHDKNRNINKESNINFR